MTKACDSQKDIQYPILFLSTRFCRHDDEEAEDTNKELFGLVAYYILCNIALTESLLYPLFFLLKEISVFMLI